jgi:dienelactone hydrolase
MTKKRFYLGSLFLPLLLGAIAPASAQQDGLAYNASAPLDLKVVGVEKKAGVTVTDVTFASVAGGQPIQAYVVRPESGAGPFAGVLFVHWYAPPAPTSNRTQYLQEAEALARRGTVSLLVSTFWSDPARYKGRRWEDDYQNSLNQTKELRRALDVLLAQPGVDPQRIGYVGHDYGAMFGAVVASVDPRPKAYVLIAGTARFADWYLYGSGSGVPKGDAVESFRKQLAPIEPVNVIGKSKAALFFQFGEQDGFTPREDFIAFYMAAPDPKRISTYPSKHAMDADIIRLDRDAWLAEQLGLAVAPAPQPAR